MPARAVYLGAFRERCFAGKTLADQIGTCREESKASRARSGGPRAAQHLSIFVKPPRRAKEALAAKAKAEQELRALALQLETAVARAHECEEKERLAEESASKLKVILIMRRFFLQNECQTFFSRICTGCSCRSCS